MNCTSQKLVHACGMSRRDNDLNNSSDILFFHLTMAGLDPVTQFRASARQDSTQRGLVEEIHCSQTLAAGWSGQARPW
jgi:hypothetical protein